MPEDDVTLVPFAPTPFVTFMVLYPDTEAGIVLPIIDEVAAV